MRLTIVSPGLALSEAIRNHVERRSQFALGRFAPSIQSVHVCLRDENGPRGGVDKLCRVLVMPRSGSPFVVEGRGSQFVGSIDRTLQRAGRALTRLLKRSKG
jgi:putative sigma-54 modulation protein